MTALLRTLSVAVLGWGLACFPVQVSEAEDYQKVVKLLDTQTTILGQPLAYPADAPAQVTALIITMDPGEETGWHRHAVPLFATLLAGEVTVDYGEDGERTYRTGDSFMEAVGSWHNGRNSGTEPARLLAVFMGAAGVPNVERR